MQTEEEKLDGIEYYMRVNNIWSSDLLETAMQKACLDEERNKKVKSGFSDLARINMIDSESNCSEPRRKDRSGISDFRLVKKLRQFLRAAAIIPGTPIDEDGYIDLDWILEKPEFYGITKERIMRIIQTPANTPFEYKTAASAMFIRVQYGGAERGRYGCRVKLAPQDLTAPLSFVTKRRNLREVLKAGIHRNHASFIVFQPETRKDKQSVANITVFVNAARACEAGIEFYADENQRVVTRGDRDACIPPEFVYRIQYSNTGRIMYPQCQKPTILEESDSEVGNVMLMENDIDFAHHAWVSFGDETVDRLMLLDTGAQISILQFDAYTRIPEKLRPALVKSDTKICVGDGAQLGCEGMAIFKMQINYQDFYHKLYVCRKASHSILGNNFLVKYDGVISLGDGKLTLRGHPVPIFNRFGQELKRKVQLVCNVEVAAGQETEIPARISGKDTPGRPVIFEPNVKTVHCYGIMMPAILYSGCDSRVRLRVFNTGDQPVKLNALLNVGEVSEIEESESLVNLKTYDGKYKTEPAKFEFKERNQQNTSGEEVKQVCHSTQETGSEAINRVNCVETQKSAPETTQKPTPTADMMEKLNRLLQKTEMPEHMKVIHEKSTVNLEPSEQARVTDLLLEFEDIFAKDSKDIGKTTLITHDVNTGDAKPVCQAVRRQSPEEHRAMKEIVEELYRVGVIAPSRSQWASNIRMAKKKNGSWRMCIDYRDLNKRTIIHDPYPLPRIDSMLDALGEGRYFSCLDLISGYHQVPLTPEAQERTAFITPKMSPSHWEYKYMPFGLMSAPATFQRLVDTMLRGIQYDTCMAYLDDIIVISSTISEGIDRLKDVFERIRMAKLKLKAEKCDLFKEEITYLGHVISADGVRTDPKKISAVKDFTIPLFVTDVRGFLGLCSYYRRFIKDFSNLTKPLNDLTKKDSDRRWLKKHTEAFEELKRLLSETPVLAYPREDCVYTLDTDASGFAIGAVLSQMQPVDEKIMKLEGRDLKQLQESVKPEVQETEDVSELNVAKSEDEQSSDGQAWDSHNERCEKQGYKKRPGCLGLQIIEDAINRRDRKQKKDADEKEEGEESKVNLISSVKLVDGVWMAERPIAYASRMLLPRELSYCARRREFLAIYEMVQYFQHYLAGTKFILRTDHDSLKGVRNLSKMSGQFARWIDYLEGFQFEIQARKGTENANADFLSRMYSDCFCKERGKFMETPSACEALENEPVVDWELFEACNKEVRDRRIRNKWCEIIKIEDPDALAKLTMEQLDTQLKLATKIPSHKESRGADFDPKSQWVNVITTTQVSDRATSDVGDQALTTDTVTPPITSLREGAKSFVCAKQTKATSSEETITSDNELDGQESRHVGTFKPRWTVEQLRQAQRDDEDLGVIYVAKVDNDGTKPEWNALSFEGLGCKFYYNLWSKIKVRQNLLYREWESAVGDYTRLQLIIPKNYQTQLIRDVHCSNVGNHQGNHRTLEFLRLRFFWHSMGDCVKTFIRQCIVCQQAKILNKTPRTPMQVHGAGFPNERVNVDFCGPFGDRETEVRYLMVVCDAFTKFTVAVPTKDMTARTAVEVMLDRWINIFGAPYEIHSDRGASFTAATWKEFCERMGILRTLTTSYRPQANGQVERSNRSILEMLRAMVTDVSEWDFQVSHICAAYNFTPHAAHGFSPYFLMFGRHPYSFLDVTMPTKLNGPARPVSETVRKHLDDIDRAHTLAREKLKAAAEVSRRFYNRGHRLHIIEYEVGECAWLRIDQVREFGKLTDKFHGPYFVVTKWGTGSYRIARTEGEPPKIVHHDRMRKYLSRTEEPMPEFIREMIRRFNRSTTVTTQTNWSEEEEERVEIAPSLRTRRKIRKQRKTDSEDTDSEQEEEEQDEARVCAVCDEPEVDASGIFHRIFADGICHICRG